MPYKPPETKWQKRKRLLKKWHPLWLPLAIIFFDRLFIMWPYIPIGEATSYMKAQAIETFDWSILWTIHVAETLFLLLLWIWLVCFSIALCAFFISVGNRVWKEDKYQRAIEKSVVFKIHCVVAAEQVHKYLRRIYKETKQDKFLLDNWPFGQFAVQALPRREFRKEAKSLPSHKIPGDLAATPADFADYMSAFKYVLKRVRETFETEVLPARRQGKVVEVQPAREGSGEDGGNTGQAVSGTRGAGEPSAGLTGPDKPETVMTGMSPSQPPVGEAGMATGATVATTTVKGGDADVPPSQENPVAGDKPTVPLPDSSKESGPGVDQSIPSRHVVTKPVRPEEHKPSAGLAGTGTLEAKPDGAEGVGGSIQEAAAALAPPSQESRVEKEPSDEARQTRHEESATNPAVSDKAQPAFPEQEGEGDQFQAAADEAAAPSSAEAQPSPPAPAAPIKWISLKEAEEELSNTIARRNRQRPNIGLPPLAATDIAKIRQEIFSRVDPAELEANREGQSPAPDAAQSADGGEQGSSADMPDAREPQPTRCEESGLVMQPREDQEDEELEEDEDHEDEQVSPERWEKVLQLAGGDPLEAAVLLFMEGRDVWQGPSTELCAILNLYAPEKIKNSKEWPNTAPWLTKTLIKNAVSVSRDSNKTTEALLKVGIIFIVARTKQGSTTSLKRCHLPHG